MTTDRMARARAAKAAKRTAASVEEYNIGPDGRIGGHIDTAEIFAARHENEMVTQRTIDEGVETEHNRPGTITMYKPTGDGRSYSPRTVSVAAIRQLLRQGWSEFCPVCGGEHLDRNGKPSSDPNLCKKKTPVAVRVCPECGKRIYDNMGVSLKEDMGDADYDPNVLQDDAYTKATPAERTQASLNIHMWVRHSRAAFMRGLDPLPAALQEMIPNERPL